MIGMSGDQEQAEAKRWALINAGRMKETLVVIARPDGNSEAHLGWLRGWIARRPMMFALLLIAISAWATRLAHGLPL